MSLAQIHAAIPHRKPFLLVDEIVEQSERRIVCRKTFSPDEWFYAGHYPNFAVTPGVLLCEAAMQAGAILLSPLVGSISGVPVVARMNDVRFKRMIHPGETIEIEAELTERLRDAFYFKATVTSAGTVAVRFEFTCKMAAVG